MHLHVTRRCNLACKHCYSSSSPQATEALDKAVTIDALGVLRREGYDTIALSGGEPFLHPDLPAIATAGKDMGFRISVISNGVLINERILDTMRDVIDTVAISFDGQEATHNLIRGRKDAFARAVRTLDALADRGIPFALSCTAAHDRLEDVVDLYELAADKGAGAMQISPIVAVGRASDASEFALDEEEKARLALMAKVLDQDCSGPRVRVELQPQALFQQARAQFGILSTRAEDAALSDIVNPLVVTELGALQPFAYGLNPAFDIGRTGPTMADDIEAWRKSGLHSLRSLVMRSFEDESVRTQAFVEWYADLVHLSHVNDHSVTPIAAE